MARLCRYCYYKKPNEAFSGKGYNVGICKKCAKKPKDELYEIEAREFVYKVFHNQSTISTKNIKYLEEVYEKFPNKDIGEMAITIAQIGKIRPYKKKRIGWLYFNKKDYFDILVKHGIIRDSITERINEEIEEEKYFEEYLIRIKENENEDLNTRDNNTQDEKCEFEEELPF